MELSREKFQADSLRSVPTFGSIGCAPGKCCAPLPCRGLKSKWYGYDRRRPEERAVKRVSAHLPFADTRWRQSITGIPGCCCHFSFRRESPRMGTEREDKCARDRRYWRLEQQGRAISTALAAGKNPCTRGRERFLADESASVAGGEGTRESAASHSATPTSAAAPGVRAMPHRPPRIRNRRHQSPLLQNPGGPVE